MGFPDLAQANPTVTTNALGISGLLGATPAAPRIVGAVPLTDPRAVFNDRATFALGEFSLGRQGAHPQIDIRRSDQDRQIIKSPTMNDNNDLVTPNPTSTSPKCPTRSSSPRSPWWKCPSPTPRHCRPCGPRHVWPARPLAEGRRDHPAGRRPLGLRGERARPDS